MKVALRPAAAEDRSFLERVYACSRDYEMRLIDWPEEQKHAFLREQFEAQTVHYSSAYHDAEFSVILLGEESAGRLIVHRGVHETRVVDIAVLPEFRGRGIGSCLIGRLISEAFRSGLPLSIHVELFNPAYRWYERIGFRRAGEHGPYIYMVHGGTAGDAR